MPGKEGAVLISLSGRLAREQPARLVPKKSAGVAVIFLETQDDEQVLLIRRAEKEDDTWSGQVAFPGGMVNPADKSFEETARREAKEEVGIDLSGSAAASLGYMGAFKARMKDITVVPSVFKLNSAPALSPNKEVAACEWTSLKELAAEKARSSYLIPRGGGQIPFPCIVHGGLVIWGLTERILSTVIKE